MFQKKCETCAIYLPQNLTCQIMTPAMQGKIKPTDYCSHHKDKSELLTCDVCGRGLLNPIIETKDDGVHVYCDICLAQQQ